MLKEKPYPYNLIDNKVDKTCTNYTLVKSIKGTEIPGITINATGLTRYDIGWTILVFEEEYKNIVEIPAVITTLDNGLNTVYTSVTEFKNVTNGTAVLGKGIFNDFIIIGENNKLKCFFNITKTSTKRFNKHVVNEDTDELTI